jgi:hypothetical protein
MAIQGTEPLRGGIALWQRGLFVIAALCLLFPTTIWVDLVGLALLVTGWAPSLLRRPGATGQASPNRS